MQNPEIEIAAAELYSPSLPYHNFGHARRVAGEAARIVEKCQSEGVPVDPAAVYYGALLHDAGYYEDHVGMGFETKEAYSAHLAENLLRGAGIDEDTIGRVQDAILATHYAVHCKNNEAKALRAADLAGLAADYKVFKTNAAKLRREHEMLGGGQITWSDWKQNVREGLELYMHEDLHLTSDYYDEDGEPVIYKRARANLERLLMDTTEPG